MNACADEYNRRFYEDGADPAWTDSAHGGAAAPRFDDV